MAAAVFERPRPTVSGVRSCSGSLSLVKMAKAKRAATARLAISCGYCRGVSFERAIPERAYHRGGWGQVVIVLFCDIYPFDTQIHKSGFLWIRGTQFCGGYMLIRSGFCGFALDLMWMQE